MKTKKKRLNKFHYSLAQSQQLPPSSRAGQEYLQREIFAGRYAAAMTDQAFNKGRKGKLKNRKSYREGKNFHSLGGHGRAESG